MKTGVSNFTSLATSAADGIVARAGGGFANATQLGAANNRVSTVATAGDSVKLPDMEPGQSTNIYNAGAASMQVFGFNATDTINGVVGSTGMALAAGKTSTVTCYGNGVFGANVSA